ncbi:polysaccharide deacetylase family protein [Paraclostridium ghonii]|uniref:polysaccharide deacetylase family protein n=1 Tax=Paraclostridium ghonii TaxID=29358 RepID=UPI00202CAA4C|nr:polysaccharide deacetylase family protein [Paeniclostridium ghonii]MCM0165283.1 polysaccharide deacetylase family protein [Paeniclostridium ghonii]
MNRKIAEIKSLISSFLFFVFTLTAVFGIVYSVRYIGENMSNEKIPISNVETDDRKISLTFDIASGSSNIETILDTLDKYNVKASFFLVGNWVDKNEDIVKEISSRGHDIGNHSNTHASMKQLSENDLKNELNATSSKIEAITGEKTTMYRPPFGEFDNNSLKTCEKLGYTVVNWDVDSYDWKEIGPNFVTEKVLKGVSPGSIVLFHGDINNNEQYLEKSIKELKEKYDIVPLTKLIYNEGYEVDSNGTQKLKSK